VTIEQERCIERIFAIMADLMPDITDAMFDYRRLIEVERKYHALCEELGREP